MEKETKTFETKYDPFMVNMFLVCFKNWALVFQGFHKHWEEEVVEAEACSSNTCEGSIMSSVPGVTHHQLGFEVDLT